VDLVTGNDIAGPAVTTPSRGVSNITELRRDFDVSIHGKDNGTLDLYLGTLRIESMYASCLRHCIDQPVTGASTITLGHAQAMQAAASTAGAINTYEEILKYDIVCCVLHLQIAAVLPNNNTQYRLYIWDGSNTLPQRDINLADVDPAVDLSQVVFSSRRLYP
jgi:hypothetical protein